MPIIQKFSSFKIAKNVHVLLNKEADEVLFYSPLDIHKQTKLKLKIKDQTSKRFMTSVVANYDLLAHCDFKTV